jgi:diphthamide biosynthesis methyltransferase
MKCTECRKYDAIHFDELCEECYRDSFFVENDEAKILKKNEETSISFLVAGEPVLQLMYDGRIMARGKEVEKDSEIVDAFREFLRANNFLNN